MLKALGVKLVNRILVGLQEGFKYNMCLRLAVLYLENGSDTTVYWGVFQLQIFVFISVKNAYFRITTNN